MADQLGEVLDNTTFSTTKPTVRGTRGDIALRELCALTGHDLPLEMAREVKNTRYLWRSKAIRGHNEEQLNRDQHHIGGERHDGRGPKGSVASLAAKANLFGRHGLQLNTRDALLKQQASLLKMEDIQGIYHASTSRLSRPKVSSVDQFSFPSHWPSTARGSSSVGADTSSQSQNVFSRSVQKQVL